MMFKKSILFLAVGIFCASVSFSLPTQAPTKLVWDPNPANSTLNITHYEVHWSLVSGDYNNTDMYATLDRTQQTAIFTDMAGLVNPEGKFYVVVAVDDKGIRSQFSNEVFNFPFVAPGAPGLLRTN